jgi:hypothetical protein
MAFHWMLPSPRPNLKDGVDNVSAANLKIALSVAYPILNRYSKLAKDFPAFFIYNSWRHVCRLLRELELSMGDQIHRACVNGWINGCCNLQSQMSIHRGRTFMMTNKPTDRNPVGVRTYARKSGEIEIKILTSSVRDCFWVLIYYKGWLSGSYKYNHVSKTSHIANELDKLLDAGGLYCIQSYGHFMSFNKIIDALFEGRSVYEVNMPPELYLMNLSSTELIEAWQKGELSVKYGESGFQMMETDSELSNDLYQLLGPTGQLGLTHLLAKKYDVRTANTLSMYSREYWLDNNDYLNSLKFLIEKNCSKTFRGYVGKNWQGKRYCNDICHLLYLSGYPRLWYYEKDMRPTKKCHPFMLLCEYKVRDHTVLIKGARKGFNYLKEKRRLTKNINEAYQDYAGGWHSKGGNFQKCHLINYELEVKKLNEFKSRDRLFNKLSNAKQPSIEKRFTLAGEIDGAAVLEAKNKESEIKAKMSYADRLLKNIDVVAEEIVKVDRCRALAPIFKQSLQNCKKAREDLTEILDCNLKTSPESTSGWQRPKNASRKWLKFNVGRSCFSVRTDNIYDILDNYEQDCTDKLKNLSEVERGENRDIFDDTIDLLKAEANYSRNRLHKKLRSEREWGSADPEIITRKMAPRNLGKGRVRQKDKRKNVWIKNNNKRASEIQSCKKRGVVSKHIKIRDHYQQYRCIRVVKLRKSKILTEARKRVKVEPMCLFPFPKLDFSGQKYDDRGPFHYTPPLMPKMITFNKWELPLKDPVRYHDKFGEIILDRDCALYTAEGVELYLDEIRTIRYAIYPDGEIMRFGKRGNRSKNIGPKQPKIKITKFDEFTPEILSLYLRNLLDYYS